MTQNIVLTTSAKQEPEDVGRLECIVVLLFNETGTKKKRELWVNRSSSLYLRQEKSSPPLPQSPTKLLKQLHY